MRVLASAACAAAFCASAADAFMPMTSPPSRITGLRREPLALRMEAANIAKIVVCTVSFTLPHCVHRERLDMQCARRKGSGTIQAGLTESDAEGERQSCRCANGSRACATARHNETVSRQRDCDAGNAQERESTISTWLA